jgi:hypothetical protein
MQSGNTVVSKPGIDAGDFQASLLTISGPLLFARKSALRVRQTTLTAAKMLWIGDFLAGAEHSDIFQPYIHTHHRIDNRQ